MRERKLLRPRYDREPCEHEIARDSDPARRKGEAREGERGVSSLPTIAEVQAATAREFGIPVALMREPFAKGPVQEWTAARPRQAAMALSALLTERQLTVIGRMFGGRDHSTVIHASKAIAKRRRSDPALHAKLRRITLELLRDAR